MESRFSSMPFDHGEGVSAAAEYGESVHRPKLRARRSAAARREQQRRSEARHFVRLLQGLQSIERHRGNELSPLGHSLLNAMRDTTRRDSAMPYRGDAQRSPTTYSICRHYMANRCTWGDRCRFRHEGVPDHSHSDHNYQDYDEDHDNSDNNVHSDDDYRNNSNCNDSYGDTSEEDNNNNNNSNDGGGYCGDNYHYDNTQHNHDGQVTDDIDDIMQVLNALSQDPDAQQQALATLPEHLLQEVLSRCEKDSSSINDDDDFATDTAMQHLANVRAQLHNNLTNLAHAIDAQRQYEAQQDGATQPLRHNPQEYDGPSSEDEVIDLDGNDAHYPSIGAHISSPTDVQLDMPDSLKCKISEFLRMHNRNKKHVRKFVDPNVLLQYFRERSNISGTIPKTCSSSYAGTVTSQSVAGANVLKTTVNMSASIQDVRLAEPAAENTPSSVGSSYGTVPLSMIIEVLNTLDGQKRQEAIASLPDRIRSDIDAHFATVSLEPT